VVAIVTTATDSSGVGGLPMSGMKPGFHSNAIACAAALRKRKPQETQALAFLAVFVYATHATQAITFEWKPGLSLGSRSCTSTPNTPTSINLSTCSVGQAQSESYKITVGLTLTIGLKPKRLKLKLSNAAQG